MIKTRDVTMKFLLVLILISITSLQPTFAEQKVTKGHLELHYNTFPSTFLDSKVATNYQIKRSKSRGIVSITVIDTELTPASAIEAAVTIEAQNILGQQKTIEIKTIKENDGSIYYLGLFRMNNEESINFKISAKSSSNQALSHTFTREFFTD
ncbi:DUF4426 domain-containing protein [Marinicella rhabdoformis]|uniref:DUF4426 domain-containing protein n=1 Tax=Marinicella rhabdoformis TaxID=2580566 RepID=UPI0012AED3A4|nr:DUF4426 domain-containing protein [Marinicella rhabdoformis]